MLNNQEQNEAKEPQQEKPEEVDDSKKNDGQGQNNGQEDGQKKDESKTSIPRESYEAVAKKYKQWKSRAEGLEKKLGEIETTKLKEKEDYKTLAEKFEQENRSLKLQNFRQKLLSEAVAEKKLNPKLSKLVSGNNEEEIQSSLEEALKFNNELLESFKNDKMAKDPISKNKIPNKNEEEMSDEEFEKLAAEDPNKARAYLIRVGQNQNVK